MPYSTFSLFYYSRRRKIDAETEGIFQRPPANLAKVMPRRILKEIAMKLKKKMEAGTESYDVLEGRSCHLERSQ